MFRQPNLTWDNIFISSENEIVKLYTANRSDMFRWVDYNIWVTTLHIYELHTINKGHANDSFMLTLGDRKHLSR